ncbi:MAG: hypothetical protein WBY53_11455 [Acidobacteriaceae bacterium]
MSNVSKAVGIVSTRGKAVLLAVVLVSVSAYVSAQEQQRPFELGYTTSGNVSQVVAQVEQKLAAGGFEVVGTYAPYANLKFSKGESVSAEVIGVTNAALKQAAAQTDFGGYAVVQRISVTRVNDQIQVTYTNPVYMANAYRLKSNLANVKAELAKALGAQQGYGSKSGLSPAALQSYHYKVMMPYFTDQDMLAEHGSYQQALDAVNAGLAAHKGGTSKVYQVAIPGKEETLFGVALAGPSDNACGGDGHVMGIIDDDTVKSTGHLPYGILVSGGKAYALPAKFRIAVNFPDLSMMGSNGFLTIRCAPGSIEKSLKDASQ